MPQNQEKEQTQLEGQLQTKWTMRGLMDRFSLLSLVPLSVGCNLSCSLMSSFTPGIQTSTVLPLLCVFVVASQVKRQAEVSQGSQIIVASNTDYSLKEGEKIRVDLVWQW